MPDDRHPRMFWDLWSLGIGQVLSVLLGFVGFGYLARVLTTESYGSVEYVIGLTGLAAIVIEGGMGTIGALGVSRSPDRAPELAARIPAARLLVAFVVVPLVGTWGALTNSDPQVTTLIWLFAFSLFAIPFKQDWLLQGLEKMKHVAPALAVKSAAFAVGVVVAVHASEDLLKVGILEIAAALLGAAYYIAAQRAISIPLRVDWEISKAWQLIRQGASVGGINIVWAFILYAPMFLTTELAGRAEAAWLGGTQRLVVALVTFSAIYFFNLYPLMVRGLAQDRAQFQRLMGSSFRLIAWSSIGVAFGLTLIADLIVMLAFGEPFLEAAPVFALYIWVLPLRLLSGHARYTLLAAERQGLLLLTETIGASTIVIAGIVLIPRYGAMGAATAVVVGNVVAWIAAHVVAERAVGRLPGLGDLLLPVGAALVSAGLARWFKGSPILSVGLAAVTYAVCIRLTARDVFNDAVRLAYAKKTTR